MDKNDVWLTIIIFLTPSFHEIFSLWSSKYFRFICCFVESYKNAPSERIWTIMGYIQMSAYCTSNWSFPPILQVWKISPQRLILEYTASIYLLTSCGHVVKEFESEAKTRCNF